MLHHLADVHGERPGEVKPYAELDMTVVSYRVDIQCGIRLAPLYTTRGQSYRL